MNNYAKNGNLFKDVTPVGEDFREGLTAIVSVRVLIRNSLHRTK